MRARLGAEARTVGAFAVRAAAERAAAGRGRAAGLTACAFLSALFAAFFATLESFRKVLSWAFASRTRFFASAARSTARFAAAASRRLAAMLLIR